MLYLANPCGDATIKAMTEGLIGLIETPAQGSSSRIEDAHAGRVTWCADNGCFTDNWKEDQWWAFLTANAHRASTCLFATAPDVVGDAAATITRSAPWLPKIRALGYPAAFVAQDGLENLDIPWSTFDVLFIGGSTEWKLGPYARAITTEAKQRGKWVHMGRVNSEKRWKYANAIGCDSVDGTFLVFAPIMNLQRLLAWVRNNDQETLF